MSKELELIDLPNRKFSGNVADLIDDNLRALRKRRDAMLKPALLQIDMCGDDCDPERFGATTLQAIRTLENLRDYL